MIKSRTSSQMNEWSNGNSRPSTALNGEPHYAQQSRSNQGNGVKQSSGSSSHPVRQANANASIFY